MSAKDIFHNIVKVALEKDGWKITHAPLFFKLSEQIRIRVDLGAQKLILAEKDEQKIAVKVLLGCQQSQNFIQMLVNF